MTGELPNQREVRLAGELVQPGVAGGRLAKPVVVEKDEVAIIGGPALAPPFVHSLHGKFDDRARIPAARLQNDRIEMNRQSRILDQTSEERNVALLALALTADEEPFALRPEGTPTPHPICGTAP